MKTCSAVEDAMMPTTRTEMRSFLGLCNVFRRFVPNFTHIAAPLNWRLEKDEPVRIMIINEAENRAFEDPKGSLVAPPIPALPRRSGKYRLDTDDCDQQLRCT